MTKLIKDEATTKTFSSTSFFKGATAFSITTLSIMTLSITTLSREGLFVTLRINETHHKRHSALTVSRVIMLNVIMLSDEFFIDVLSIVMMSVVAPLQNSCGCFHNFFSLHERPK